MMATTGGVAKKVGLEEFENIRRSGLWGTNDIGNWLGEDGAWFHGHQWAILWRDGLLARVDRYGWQAPAALMLSLLERHYESAGTVAYHGITLHIYRRKP